MDLFLHYLSLPYLLTGIEFTLQVTGLGLVGGALLGILLAAMQLGRFALLAAAARFYAVVFRGTPLILQLVFAYDALPQLGLKLSAVAAAGLALAANEAPFIAEILRSGVLGVDRGQIAAGQALGMTPAVLMRRVIAPQAVRSMVPAFGNETVSALKNSSLASVISVEELTLRSTQLASSTFDFFSIFFASGLIYLVLTGAVALVQIGLEWVLDLDRPPPRERLRRLLSWPRNSLADALATAAEDGAPAQANAPDTAVARPMEAPRPAPARGGAALEVSGLCKSYGARTVLDGLDLRVGAGEVVALLGASGSGKSTLLRCINHLEGWSAGDVRLDGRRIGFRDDGRPLSPRALAQERAALGVGMVFQHFNLFGHLSARENVAGPLRWVQGLGRIEAMHRADALLARVGLAARADALPRHLSGGQQQRVAIARALAPSPKVLLLDEPTSALDPELVGEVLEVIRRLAAEERLTMIISTHQLRFAATVADRVVFLSNGSIAEQGPAREVLAHPRHAATARFLRAVGAGAAEMPA